MMMRYSFDRRRFLHGSAFGALTLAIDGALPKCFADAAQSESSQSDRILVVVQLSGGNDGLNTVIPYDDDAYRAARPMLSIPKSDALTIDDRTALHPGLRGMRDLMDEGKFTVIQGVGYENPNRSHFESMDIWHTCVQKEQPRTSGWLGRTLERLPVKAGGDVSALHLGDQQQPLALASETVRVPTVKQLNEFQLRGTDSASLRKLLSDIGATSGHGSEDLLDFLRSSTESAIAASGRVTQAAGNYQPSTPYPASRLAEQLQVVAQLIDAGMKTRIYYLQLDGFDTHAEQKETHAILLRQWSDAVTAFVRDLQSHGHHERTCVLTFSEFGRRVAENASGGTDHGAAGPVFLSGGRLKAGLVGSSPLLEDLQEGDLKHQIDFRCVYASVLRHWLGVDPDPILGGPFAPLPLFV